MFGKVALKDSSTMKVIRCLFSLRWPLSATRNKSSFRIYSTDSCGIPTKPTWSVKDLLSSYPSPRLSNKTFKKLHELSALVPLEEGTLDHENVKHDLEEMIRLVEAVKLVDTKGVTLEGRGVEEDADRVYNVSTGDKDGRALLQPASQAQNGFYVVDAERRR